MYFIKSVNITHSSETKSIIKKIYIILSSLSLSITLSSQEVKWQKDISCSTQHFLLGNKVKKITRQAFFLGVL